MNLKRKRRLIAIVIIVIGVSVAVSLILTALKKTLIYTIHHSKPY